MNKSMARQIIADVLNNFSIFDESDEIVETIMERFDEEDVWGEYNHDESYN